MAKLLVSNGAAALLSTSRHLNDLLTKSGEIETAQKSVDHARTGIGVDGSLFVYEFPRLAQ